MNAATLKCLVARISAVEPALGAIIRAIVARALVPCHVGTTKDDLPPAAIRTVNCLGHRASGYTVVIPDVLEIAPRAFYNEAGLLHVELPKHLMLIGEYAFAGTSITTLAVPDTVSGVAIGNNMLFACVSLTAVSLPGSMRHIHPDPHTFYNATKEEALGIDVNRATVRYRKQYSRRNLDVHDASGAIHSRKYQRRLAKIMRRADRA
jgi:hypothetical protein